MADRYAPPFGSYTSMVTLTSNGRSLILANLVSLRNLIPAATADDAGGRAIDYSPDFDEMVPAIAARLITEINEIHRLVSNAPITNV